MKNLSLNILLAASLMVSSISAYADIDSVNANTAQLNQEIEAARKSLEGYRKGKGSRPEHFEKYRLLLIELYEQKLLSNEKARAEISKLGGYDLKAEAAANEQLEIDAKLETLEGVENEIKHQKQLAQTYNSDSLRLGIINNNLIQLNWILIAMMK